MTKKELEKKVEELERRVGELERRPIAWPVPWQTPQPVMPVPYSPPYVLPRQPMRPWEITC